MWLDAHPFRSRSFDYSPGLPLFETGAAYLPLALAPLHTACLLISRCYVDLATFQWEIENGIMTQASRNDQTERAHGLNADSYLSGRWDQLAILVRSPMADSEGTVGDNQLPDLVQRTAVLEIDSTCTVTGEYTYRRSDNIPPKLSIV